MVRESFQRPSSIIAGAGDGLGSSTDSGWLAIRDVRIVSGSSGEVLAGAEPTPRWSASCARLTLDARNVP